MLVAKFMSCLTDLQRIFIMEIMVSSFHVQTLQFTLHTMKSFRHYFAQPCLAMYCFIRVVWWRVKWF